MKLAAVSPVFNEENLITGCIKCLEDFVEKHIICVSSEPYFGESIKQDRTSEIADDLGAFVVEGYWELDHHQRNTGITMLKNYDWIICTDADMWMTRNDMEKLIDVLKKTSSNAFIIPQYSYWKDTNHILEGDDFKPVIAIRPDVRFYHIGNVDSPVEILKDIYCHHLNWCSPKNIFKKVTTYSHAPEFNGVDWYNSHYKNWSEGKAIMPNNKSFNVIRRELPNELKEYLR